MRLVVLHGFADGFVIGMIYGEIMFRAPGIQAHINCRVQPNALYVCL